MGRTVTAYAYKYPAGLPSSIDCVLSFLWAFLNQRLPSYVVYGAAGKRNLAAMFCDTHQDSCTIAYDDAHSTCLYGALESENLVGHEHIDQVALEQLYRMQNPKVGALPKRIIIDMLLTRYRVAETIV